MCDYIVDLLTRTHIDICLHVCVLLVDVSVGWSPPLLTHTHIDICVFLVGVCIGWRYPLTHIYICVCVCVCVRVPCRCVCRMVVCSHTCMKCIVYLFTVYSHSEYMVYTGIHSVFMHWHIPYMKYIVYLFTIYSHSEYILDIGNFECIYPQMCLIKCSFSLCTDICSTYIFTQ